MNRFLYSITGRLTFCNKTVSILFVFGLYFLLCRCFCTVNELFSFYDLLFAFFNGYL